MPVDPSDALSTLDLPPTQKALVKRWLDEPRFESEREALIEIVLGAAGGEDARSRELEDAFSGPLPIGTGGRRGTCGPGPNRMNAVVLRETAQGLARAMEASGVPRKVAVVYDTRRQSKAFARVVSDQLARHGIDVVLVDAPRPTPLLSFTVRSLGCGAGVVVSASHNPPEDNGIKIYDEEGAQVLGERDRALMTAIERAMEDALVDGDVPTERIRVLASEAELEEIDRPYLEFVAAQGVTSDDLGEGGLQIVYTPLHGVGHACVLPALRARGARVTFVESQGPDGGEFHTVSSANPESPAAFECARVLAEECGADLVIANDPDADRLGALARDDGRLEFLDGNRLGALLLDHVLRHAGVPPRGWVLSTIVTTPLLTRIAEAAGVDVVDDLLVGFKHHAGMLGEHPERPCVFAGEESHGYLRGNDVRDKDGILAALLLTEAAASLRRGSQTLFDRLRELWGAHGYHRERTVSVFGRGVRGGQAIAAVVASWRTQPPRVFGGRNVVSVEDRSKPRHTSSATRNLPGDVLVYELEPARGVACRLVVRPSGTEPKIKLYALARSLGPVDTDRLSEEVLRVDGVVDDVLDDVHRRAVAIMQPLLRE